MPKLIISLLFIHVLNFAAGQNQIKKFVEQTAVSIPTIDPDAANFSDLEVIGNAIGDSRIVLLGEQDHGDAPTFLAKTRLIKYLHEKKGFNVLAFESDFFGLNFGFDRLDKNKANIDSFLQKNIFSIWTFCNTCQHLFHEYIPATYQTKNPLRITGFDNQLVLNFSSNHLTFYLDSLLQSLKISITKQKNYKSEILPLIDSLKYYYFKDTANYSKCESYLTEIKNQVSTKLSENDFWIQVINSLLAANKEYQLLKIDNITAGSIRDNQMASNLKWLANENFPKEKIIVWAANGHVAKYKDNRGKNGRAMISMGSYFTQNEKYLNETYVIGFTSYEGVAGRLGSKTYSVRKSKGFENWINKSFNYAFVDFKKYGGDSEQFYLKGLGHNTFFKRDWTKIFDGIFYIKEMYPCER